MSQGAEVALDLAPQHQVRELQGLVQAGQRAEMAAGLDTSNSRPHWGHEAPLTSRGREPRGWVVFESRT